MRVAAAEAEPSGDLAGFQITDIGVKLRHEGMFSHREPHDKPNVLYQRNDGSAWVRHAENMGGATFGENLKRARNALGWSQERLAQEASLESKGYISALEKGRRPMPPGRTLERLAQALQTTPSELIGQAVGGRGFVPLVGFVGAGAAAHFYANGDSHLGEVEAPDDATPETVAVEIRGTSLGAIFESWLIFYDEVRSPVTEDLHGELCVVGLPDDRVLVKKLRPARTPGLYHLESNTEPTMNDEEVVWAAKVKNMRPR